MNSDPRRALPWSLLVPLGALALLHSARAEVAAARSGEIPFRAPLDVGAGSVAGVTQSAIGDLNGDGLADIGVFEGGKHADGRRTFAWFEAPHWTRHEFHPGLEPGPFVGAAAFADIDLDGRLDVVVSSDLHSGGTPLGSMYWFRNPGGAATGPWPRHTIVQDLADTEHINDIGIADMDRDGRPDVVIRHLGSVLRVRILFQDGPERWTVRSFQVRAREGLELADLDRDGRMDIVLNGFWWAAPADPRREPFLRFPIDPDYHSQPVAGLNNSVKIGVGDIDADGRADVVFSVAEGDALRLAWYQCPPDPRSGAWTRNVIEEPFTNGHQAELGDMDGDGDLDLVNGLAFGSTGVFVYRNEGLGARWTKQVLTTSVGIYSGVIGDLGADGDLDIVGGDGYSSFGRPWIHENLSVDSTASARPRNGSGVNPAVLSATTPVLGAAWTAELDASGYPRVRRTSLFGCAAPSSGIPTPYGELLVDPSSTLLFTSSAVPSATDGIARHVSTLPSLAALVGSRATVQGVLLGGGVRFTNAIDLVLGF